MDLKQKLTNKRVRFKQSSKSKDELWVCHGELCQKRGESPDHRYRLGVNVRTGEGHCFNCGWKSRKAVEVLARELDLGHIETEFQEVEQEEKKINVNLPEDFEILTGSSKDHWFRKAKEYITARGISEFQIQKHEIGYSIAGRYGYRIIFPVKEGKKLVGFVSRSFLNKEPRYLNTPGMKSLYNLTQPEKMPIVVASEGVFKALKIERVLYSRLPEAFAEVNSVALLGHGLTDRQEQMLDGVKEICIWPDPDNVGIKSTIELARRLSTRIKVTIPFPQPLKQADELTNKEVFTRYINRKVFAEGLLMKYTHYLVMQKRFGDLNEY